MTVTTDLFKRPESVLVVVYTAGGEVLLLRRRRPPEWWQSVTGSLEWGESAAAAARRELREETGLDRPVEDCGVARRFHILPAWRGRYAPGVMENLEHQYALRLAHREPISVHPDEHTEYRWVAWQHALRAAKSWTNREAILQLLGNSRVDIPD